MTIKKGSIVELTYTGKMKEDNQIFDTTDRALAQKEGIYNEKAEYGPIVVCIGQGHILKGLDEQLVGKDVGKHTFTISPEQGFGKKETKLIQLIPTNKFLKQGIKPMPGQQINIDGIVGRVKTVTGGRTVVDFNHPLSGQELEYDVDVKKILTGTKEQVEGLLKLMVPGVEYTVGVEDKKVTITLPQIPPEASAKEMKEKLQKMTGVKDVEFKAKAKEEKKEEEKEA